MRLHVLTACSRPENLPALAESIEAAACEPWDITWHVRFDIDRLHVGGQKVKNDLLGTVRDGWVYFLDDDTTMHPGLLRAITPMMSHANVVVVSQDRADGRYLRAHPDNVRVGDIDIGQAVIRRGGIGSLRLPETYEGDGHFLMQLVAQNKTAYVDATLSHHNKLERVPA